MWGVMGALTGVAFGAITSYYFTDQTYRDRVSKLEPQLTVAEAKVKGSTLDWSAAVMKAGAFKSEIDPFRKVLIGGEPVPQAGPIAIALAQSLTEDQRKELAVKLDSYYGDMQAIESLGLKWTHIEPQ